MGEPPQTLARVRGEVELLLSGSARAALPHLRAALRMAAAGKRDPEQARRRALEDLREELTERGAAYPKRAAVVDRCLRELASLTIA
jgi:hypothetical protein